MISSLMNNSFYSLQQMNKGLIFDMPEGHFSKRLFLWTEVLTATVF